MGFCWHEIDDETDRIYRMAWLVLPIAVHLVELNSQASTAFMDVSSPNMQRLRSLMTFLYLTINRFDGIKYVSKVIDTTLAAISDTINCLQRKHPMKYT